MNDKIFYTTFISIIAGIGLYTAQRASRMLFLFLILVFFLYFIYKKFFKESLYLHVVLVIVFCLIGFVYAYLRTPVKIVFENSIIQTTGKIITIPEKQNGLVEYVLKTKNYNILLNENTFENRELGQKVSVSFEPLELINKNNKNYEQYLLAQSILVKGNIISFKQIDPPSFLYRKLNSVRRYIQNTFDNFMSYPESGLASGLILGNRSWMNSGLYNDFIRSGTIHIVALSGYNISVLISLVKGSLIYILPAIFIEYFLIIFIILFLLMTGFSVTGVRAGIMAIAIILARSYGFLAQKDRLLVLAGFLLIIWRPYSLWYDLSFQLSVIATFSVLFLAPIFEFKYFKFIKHNLLREIVATTTAATVFTAPIILYTIGKTSIVSLFANILIGPIVPIATGTNIALILTSFISPVAYLIGGLASFVHTAILFISNFFANLPFAQVEFSLPKIVLVIIYVIFTWWVVDRYKKLSN